jgi:hypothetical protein
MQVSALLELRGEIEGVEAPHHRDRDPHGRRV